ncbi:MAG: hypothetical protein COC01_05170 [Bacteroidetes bacterium]|nr:MAG: hypothetical protein COC01_05170 [Bacteroidota bacterium]
MGFFYLDRASLWLVRIIPKPPAEAPILKHLQYQIYFGKMPKEWFERATSSPDLSFELFYS